MEFRLQWGRQIRTQEIIRQTSLDQATRHRKCSIWGILNVCVEAAPDGGLCIQPPITEESGSTEELQLHLVFCCGGLCSLPVDNSMLGSSAGTRRLFTKGREACKAG